MTNVKRSGVPSVAAAVLAAALFTPLAARAQDQLEPETGQAMAAAPAAASWDETSGYGAVEASRAAINAGAFAVGADAIGPTGHEASAAIGYSLDEAYRLASAAAAPVIIANQVSPDVRWAPAGAVVAGPVVQSVPPARAIGGLQEEYLFAKSSAPSWDETSGYGAVEANRAAIDQ
jgi:hypothetical protein